MLCQLFNSFAQLKTQLKVGEINAKMNPISMKPTTQLLNYVKYSQHASAHGSESLRPWWRRISFLNCNDWIFTWVASPGFSILSGESQHQQRGKPGWTDGQLVNRQHSYKSTRDHFRLWLRPKIWNSEFGASLLFDSIGNLKLLILC